MEKLRGSSLLSRALRETKEDDVDICSARQHGFLAVPLKSTNDVDLIKPLTNYFCSNENIDKIAFKEAVQRFNSLRSEACCRTAKDFHALLDPITEYYDQLTAFENQMERGSGICIEGFKWKDAFDSNKSILGKTTTGTLLLERLSVLFNYGALLSQIAASQPFLNDDEMRTAAKLFQQSAGIFVHLRNLVQQSPQIHSYTKDLLPHTLETLSNIMLAQAQESVYRKAFAEKMNSTALVKIATQTVDFYQQAGKEMTCIMGKGYWKKEWLNTVFGKALGFQAIAQMHSAELHMERDEVGERLARLRHAVELVESMKKHLSSEYLHEQISYIQNAYKLATKDNKLIYHERVPDFNTLPELPRAALVKPLPLKQPLCSHFKDIFAFIVPSKIERIAQKFDSMKREHLRSAKEKFLEQTELTNAIVASLTVPDVLSEAVKKKSNEVREAGGVIKLQANVDELPTLRNRAMKILDKIEELLIEEDKSDADLHRQLKKINAKYDRLSSFQLTGPFTQELRRYRHSIRLASESDKLLSNQFIANRKSIEMHTKSENESLLFNPSSTKEMASEATRNLNKFLCRAQVIREENEKILKEIESLFADSDPHNMFENMTANPVTDYEVILKRKIQQVCQPVEESISSNIMRQKLFLEDIEKWSGHFSVEKSETLRLLSLGYDAFLDIKVKAEEKSKFYKSLITSLERLQRKVEDFSFARQTEKEELLNTSRNFSNPATASAKNMSLTPSFQNAPQPHQSYLPYTNYSVQPPPHLQYGFNQLSSCSAPGSSFPPPLSSQMSNTLPIRNSSHSNSAQNSQQ